MQPRLIIAAIAALGLSQYTFAVDDEAAVIVTATRFADTDPRIPANISVITKRDIAEMPSATLPDILKARAGIDVRSVSGSLGIDATADLRGFGDTAASNTLILVDGQRINPIDMGSISWSAIPLAGVQRIEIIRGSGTILYGDRASGGVINIITDKTGTPAVAAKPTSTCPPTTPKTTAGAKTTSRTSARFPAASACAWRPVTYSPTSPPIAIPPACPATCAAPPTPAIHAAPARL
jgi:iron complex outermembrane receptor protein